MSPAFGDVRSALRSSGAPPLTAPLLTIDTRGRNAAKSRRIGSVHAAVMRDQIHVDRADQVVGTRKREERRAR